ncbi:MAG TPA: nitrile hydratase subunit beta [Bryobacterales bacterium]|nr:nitrile hydratase subunit beta [Bryobacterales bacterium]
MNGVHDMGGMDGMGRIPYEKNEPVFHARWEGRVYAMNRAMSAWRKWNLDAWRHDIELLPPADYLRMSYYEKWFAALEKRVVKYGFVTPEEFASGQAAPGSAKAAPAFTREMAGGVNRDIPSSQDPSVAPLFRVGQRVRARNINPSGHTRLPRYARGKTGQIIRDHGVYSFPDTNALYRGEKRQHVYSVRFAARELWGEQASPRDSVHLDMWDDYLEHIRS